MIRLARAALLAIGLGFAAGAVPSAAGAAECTAETFAQAVDTFGARLRTYNGEAQPRLRKRLVALADKKGWSGDDREDRALAYLEDGRLSELDTQSNDLLGKIDQLGRPDPKDPIDCAKLTEIEAASAELLAVMKAKTSYLEDKIAREVGPDPAAAAAKPAEVAVAAAPAASKPDGGSVTKTELPAAKPAAAPAPPPPKPAPAKPDQSWDTKTKAPPPRDDLLAAGPPAPPPAAATLPPITFDTPEEGYTIDEIRDATRGFFGTISTNLASVIEHSFSSLGRPTGYVLGTEGGGAFLAGLRYGKGTLYLRQGGTRPIHWHGPSLGYDVGAEGGRTLILVYKMRDPAQLYRSFTGIDGSAYLVGGVGMTLLKGGDIIMAPIRSGIGVRLGANIGYLRFTDRPTWNPF